MPSPARPYLALPTIAQGRLNQITDGDGLSTQIERDALGNPTAIVAPFGQRTTLALDSNGYLAKATNPAGESHEMTYTADGLLTSFKDPRGNASTFTYDTLGRLLTDVNAGGGGSSLSRTELADGYAATVTSALNRVTTHEVHNLSTGNRERQHTQPDKTASTTLEKTDGTVVTTEADGTVITQLQGPDPRFSMLSPITKSLQTSTGGLTANLTGQRTAVLATLGNPLSLTKLTDTVTLNGRTQTTVYDAASKTFTATSPAARKSTAVIDSLGRVTQSQTTGILPVNNTYDLQGRPATIAQGSGADERLVSFAYNPEGYLDSVTDPLGRQVKYRIRPGRPGDPANPAGQPRDPVQLRCQRQPGFTVAARTARTPLYLHAGQPDRIHRTAGCGRGHQQHPVPLQPRQTTDPGATPGRPDDRLQLRHRRTHRQRHRSRRQLQL